MLPVLGWVLALVLMGGCLAWAFLAGHRLRNQPSESPIAAEPSLRENQPDPGEFDLSIDIGSLNTPPPDEHSPIGLAFYGAPVRLAVLVVAPTGREGHLPEAAEMGRLLEHWLPGIERIAGQDQPIFRRWPEQLSMQGFQHAFFQNLSLPGERGKSTPWCSACGPFHADGQRYLVGIVCRTAAANSLSEVAIERETQWLDVVRPR